MMRGGSIFAKVSRIWIQPQYCRKGMSSGSRQCSSSSNSDKLRQLQEMRAELRRRGWPNIYVYGIETLAVKALLVYTGYKLALVDSPYDPEKFASEMEALRVKNQILDDKWKELEKKEALLEAQRNYY